MNARIVMIVAAIALAVACQQVTEPSGEPAVEAAQATKLESDVMNALDAKLEFPSGLAIDAQGRVYVAEREGFRVRRVDPNRSEIATVAGLGIPGQNGDGIPASEAMIGAPESLAIDSNGDLYIGERGTFRVRRIDLATGLISTYAGSGARGFEGDGGPATAARISNPFGLAFDADDNLFIADTENHKVRMVERKSGVITTIAGTGEKGFDDGEGIAFEAKFDRPHVCVIDPDGALLIGDSFNQRLRRVEPSGALRTIAGTGEIGAPIDGKKATESPFIFFGALVYDEAGNLLITSLDNRIVRIDTGTSVISHVAGNGKEEFSGDGGPATEAGLHLPYGMVLDDSGDIIFADGKNGRIRRISSETGVIETIAGGGEIQGIVVEPPVEEE